MFLVDQRYHEELLNMARDTGSHLRLACVFTRSAEDDGKSRRQIMNENQNVMGRIAQIADEDGGYTQEGGEADFEVYARYDAYLNILNIARHSLERIEAVGTQGRHAPSGQLALAI